MKVDWFVLAESAAVDQERNLVHMLGAGLGAWTVESLPANITFWAVLRISDLPNYPTTEPYPAIRRTVKSPSGETVYTDGVDIQQSGEPVLTYLVSAAGITVEVAEEGLYVVEALVGAGPAITISVAVSVSPKR